MFERTPMYLRFNVEIFILQNQFLQSQSICFVNPQRYTSNTNVHGCLKRQQKAHLYSVPGRPM